MWQNNTKLPGLWPRYVDASGCKKPDQSPALHKQIVENGPSLNAMPNAVLADSRDPANPPISGPSKTPSTAEGIAHTLTTSSTTKVAVVETPLVNVDIDKLDDSKVDAVGKVASAGKIIQIPAAQDPPLEGNIRDSSLLNKRQLAIDNLVDSISEVEASGQQRTASPLQQSGASPDIAQEQTPIVKVDCEPQGLESPPGSWREDFTIGAMADSIYEYLPKQHMLLGGLVTQYKTMYDLASDAMTKHLLFRPMVPGEEDILVLGTASTTAYPDISGNMQLTPEQQHLLCFAGGMYAVGAKIFNREADLDIAAKLTDGCVWAYNATTTGIMPEAFLMMPCESKNQCKWNQTRWYEELDPFQSQREHNHLAMAQAQLAMVVDHGATTFSDGQSTTALVPSTKASLADEVVPTSGPLARRQLGAIENILPTSVSKVSSIPIENPLSTRVIAGDLKSLGTQAKNSEEAATSAIPSPVYDPYAAHEHYVQDRIDIERIPGGVTELVSRKYILR